jgi:hypothetical protein
VFHSSGRCLPLRSDRKRRKSAAAASTAVPLFGVDECRSTPQGISRQRTVSTVPLSWNRGHYTRVFQVNVARKTVVNQHSMCVQLFQKIREIGNVNKFDDLRTPLKIMHIHSNSTIRIPHPSGFPPNRSLSEASVPRGWPERCTRTPLTWSDDKLTGATTLCALWM